MTIDHRLARLEQFASPLEASREAMLAARGRLAVRVHRRILAGIAAARVGSAIPEVDSDTPQIAADRAVVAAWDRANGCEPAGAVAELTRRIGRLSMRLRDDVPESA